MEKKRSGLSARGKQAVRNVKHIPDRRIDFSDIPESTAEELKRARRDGRPAIGTSKGPIANLGDAKALASVPREAAKLGDAEQTLIDEPLCKATRRTALKMGERARTK